MEIVLYFIEVSYIYALTVIFIGTVLTGIDNSMSCLIIKKHSRALLISMLKAYYTYYTKKKMRKLQRKRLRLVINFWSKAMLVYHWWIIYE